MSSIYTYNLLTPAASGADVNLSNSSIKTTGAPTVNLKEATLSQFNDPITELRRRETLTPTAAATAGQVYSFNIVQTVKTLNRVVNKTYSYTSVGADPASTISSRLIALVNADSEIGVTASGSTTVVLTADSGNVEFTLTIISVGAGLTSATTHVNSAGTLVSLTAPTGVTSVSTGADGLATILAVNSNLAVGMLVNYTIAATGESITFADGSTTSPGQVVTVRVGGNVSGTQFQIGPSTDSNIESLTFTTVTAARVATLRPSYVRGTGSELASRGVVGAASATVYGEVKLNWLETPANGGAAISKSHSIYVDGTTSGSNYTSFRYKMMNAMRGVTASDSVFNTTVIAEAVSVI